MQRAPSRTKTLSNPSQDGIPAGLLDIILREFGGDAATVSLFGDFLQREDYDRLFALDLIRKARQGAIYSWETRRLAILMLENQVLRIPPRDLDQLDALLVELRLKRGPGSHVPIDQSVIKEGYSTTELAGFAAQFISRLARLERIHSKIRGNSTPEAALEDFIALSRRECRLTLARYLFTPKEVAGRILKQVRVSSGALDVEPPVPYVRDQIHHIRQTMPEFEARILDELCKTGRIYWVSDSTSSELNSLVEYPLTTVVLVVKPPGSDIEFEFKRAGRRGTGALNVVFYRQGSEVPPAHRLDGGAMRWLLQHEEMASARFARIYSAVHEADAPVSTFMSRAAVYGVPVSRGEEHIAEYFTNPRYWGDRFRQMREAMKHCVNAIRPKDERNALDQAGDLGLTVQYMAYVAPAQGILCGTSSFRLDKVAQYLSADGPRIYFENGLGRTHSLGDGKRLADEVLDEALGVYDPPATDYHDHDQYVADALSIPANRERADANYLSLIGQIGKFWGTLLGVRGFSWGESFVARNVGLRSIWEDGQWRVKIIFMDHDNLSLPDVGAKCFYPDEAFPAVSIDADYVGGGLTSSNPVENELQLLGKIYRVGEAMIERGRQALFDSMRAAYQNTQSAIKNKLWFHRFFDKLFVERARDWDLVATGFLAVNGDSAAAENWKKSVEQTLTEKGYTKKLVRSHIAAAERHRDLIAKQSFLYNPERRNDS